MLEACGPMTIRLWLVALVAPLTLVAEASAGEPASCDLAHFSGARELHETLSRRAIEIIERATTSEWRLDARLAELVSPSASFSLGAGDVGRPAGAGPSGAHALALLMNADAFRFYGWDYMDLPADSCAVQRVEVEFVDTRGQKSSRIEFTFQAGRLIGGAGWQRSIETGPLALPEAQR